MQNEIFLPSSSCLEGLFKNVPSASSTILGNPLIGDHFQIDKGFPATSYRAKPNFVGGGAGHRIIEYPRLGGTHEDH